MSIQLPEIKSEKSGHPDNKTSYNNPIFETYMEPNLANGKCNENYINAATLWTDLQLDEKLPVTKDMDKTDRSSDKTIVLTRSTSLSRIDDQEESKKTGCCTKPKWASIKTFTLLICILQAVNGLMVSGYVLSVLTTMENRFGLNSKESGFVISSYEIGSVFSVIFVSYFGNHGHVPRWIGIGGIVCGIGAFVFAIPQFIAPPYAPDYKNISADPPVCGNSPIAPAADQYNGASSTWGSYLLLITGQILMGAGGSPMLTLGATYIDNNAEKSAAALYIALMYVMMVIGPVCGFLLGSLLLQYYVYPFSEPSWLKPDDRYFVGLWWGGCFLCSAFYILSSLPFLCFPNKLSANERTATEAANNYGRNWKEIPSSVLRLALNPVYIVTTINACLVMTIVSGFTTFLPKYIETEFQQSPSISSGLTGVVAVPGLCFGIYFGGWVIKRLKLEMKGVSTLVLIVNIISSVLLLLFFVFGCQNLPIAGVTTSYNVTSKSNNYSIYNQCNSDCNCTSEYYPICANVVSDKGTPEAITYVSPCFAGCSSKNPDNSKFSYCDCIDGGGFQANYGKCDSDCVMLYPFLALLLVICMAASNDQMPLILITLRSVAEEEKAFALGVQVVILRLLCYLPAPIVYGAAIDNACLIENTNGNSDCALYDLEKFRINFAGLSAIYMAAGLLCTILLVWCIRKRSSYSGPITMTEMAKRVADHENLHIVSGALDSSARRWASEKDLYSDTSFQLKHQKTRSC